jgi:xylan 1,4-beta-xylosidase
MSGRRVPTSSTGEVPLEKVLSSGVRDQPDVAAVASRDGRRLSVVVWHYHDDDVPGPDAAIDLVASGLEKQASEATLTHYRIDERHSNVYAEWKRLGSPLAPNQNVYAQLEKASKLTMFASPERVRVERGTVRLRIDLPRQAVSLIELMW